MFLALLFRPASTPSALAIKSWGSSIVSASALLIAAGCIPLVSDGADRPSPPGNLAVTATGPTALPEGAAATFTARVSGGMAPFQFLWDQNFGPANLALDSVSTDTLTTPRFPVPGRYEFRVGVRDADGRTGQSSAVVEVRGIVETQVPDLAVIGEPAILSVDVASDAQIVSVQWEVTSGVASLDRPTETETSLTAEAEETVDVHLTLSATADDLDLQISREFEIVAVADLAPSVEVETRLGNFTLELNGRLAPRHAANFLRYVDDGFYDGLLVHRIACQSATGTEPCDPFVIQAGGFFRDADGELDRREPTRDPVASEARDELSNETVYSVAMALRSLAGTSETDPDSARTEFFVNMADNSFLDDQGFTAFARVVDGTDVLDAMVLLERVAGPIIPNEVSLPADDVIMERVRRAPRP